MKVEEFMKLKLGDKIIVARRGDDKGRLCMVVDMEPKNPALREKATSRSVTGKPLDGRNFVSGRAVDYSQKTLDLRSWSLYTPTK